ncbi:MAG: TolB family protein [Armatimonadota bacterium]
MSRFRCRWWAVGVALGLTGTLALLLGGCGSSDDQVIFLNVRERPGWGLNERLAVAALGGDGNLYLWTVTASGGGITLLTPRRTQPTDAVGGMHPAYSPNDNGARIAFAGRRGESQIIYTMSSSSGESGGLTAVTEEKTAVAGNGSDRQPSWAPDGSAILYSSNRPDGNWDIWKVTVADRARTELIADPDPAIPGSEERWPVYDPTGSGRIAFESYDSRTKDADIWLREPDGTLARLVGDATDTFADGAPWWSNDGQFIYFHSNRGGDFDIWRVEVATGALAQITNSADSDGYPVCEPNGTRIGFLRGNELWSCESNGTDLRRITRLYQ